MNFLATVRENLLAKLDDADLKMAFEMKRLAMAVTLTGGLSQLSSPTVAQSPEVKKWLGRNDMLDGWCWGDSGDSPTTDKACDLRELASAELEKLGWCYGKNDEAGYQKRWHVCGPDSQRLTAVPAKPAVLTIAAFSGVWGEVSDRCRSHRAKTEGPYFTIREARYVPEGSGHCHRPNYAIKGNTLTVKTTSQVEESGNEPVTASYIQIFRRASSGIST